MKFSRKNKSESRRASQIVAFTICAALGVSVSAVEKHTQKPTDSRRAGSPKVRPVDFALIKLPRIPVVKRRAASVQVPATNNALILADARTVQRLDLARKLLEKKDHIQAIKLLQRVIELEKDAFYYPNAEKKDVLQSVRLSSQKMIGKMPKAGQDAYRLKYGVLARNILTEASKTGNWKQTADVARKYFHTISGHEAMYRLGIYHADRSSPLAAAACFEKVRRLPEMAKKWEPVLSLRTAICWSQVGNQEKTQAALKAVLQSTGNQPVIIAGKPVALFQNPDEGPEWLAKHFQVHQPLSSANSQWTVFRGNPSRNPRTVVPVNPTNIAWRMTTITDPTDPARDQIERVESAIQTQLKKTVASLSATIQQQQPTRFPQMSPIATNDIVVSRTLGCLRGISLKTGKRLWESIPDETLENLLTTDGQGPIPSSRQIVQQLVGQRIWSDITWGTLSSDSNRVYAIEELGSAFTIYDPATRKRIVPKPSNRLVAYDLKTGRMSWSLGGSREDHNPDAQPGTFFLGSPLPLGGRLYCLAESGGEIRMMVFEHRETGKGRQRRQSAELIWSQPLLGANLRIHLNRNRRVAGTTVSHADGVLVCPTDAGYVIAIDLISRSLLWGYRYEASAGQKPPRPFPRPRPNQQKGWIDSSCIIDKGKVLLTPPGTDEIICLNLLDGEVLWKKPRGDGRYVAGIRDGKVIVVGNNSVKALLLKDGKPAWKSSLAITPPSGRGILAGDAILVPLKSAEILTVDSKTGKQIAKTKTPGGRVPGNLILSNGVLIFQGADSIEAIPLPRPPNQKVAIHR
jgi:outer membrane protein assembly factor BamB